MEDERVISFERGKQLADQLGVEFFETSAKENVNVKVTKEKKMKIIFTNIYQISTIFNYSSVSIFIFLFHISLFPCIHFVE